MRLSNPRHGTLLLPDDLLWADEFDWSALAQSEPVRTLSGANVIQQGIKRAGRPVTLRPPDNEMAWIRRHTLETLQQWAMLPETVFELDFSPRRRLTLPVLFDNRQGAVSAVPVLGYGSETAESWFLPTLKFWWCPEKCADKNKQTKSSENRVYLNV